MINQLIKYGYGDLPCPWAYSQAQTVGAEGKEGEVLSTEELAVSGTLTLFLLAHAL
jgi:hypothetical protein